MWSVAAGLVPATSFLCLWNQRQQSHSICSYAAVNLEKAHEFDPAVETWITFPFPDSLISGHVQCHVVWMSCVWYLWSLHSWVRHWCLILEGKVVQQPERGRGGVVSADRLTPLKKSLNWSCAFLKLLPCFCWNSPWKQEFLPGLLVEPVNEFLS